jgi:hypothetical protein
MNHTFPHVIMPNLKQVKNHAIYYTIRPFMSARYTFRDIMRVTHQEYVSSIRKREALK